MTDTDSPVPSIRADLHNHTHYSPDSILSPEYLLRRARERGIDVIAVTDHNTVHGGLVVQELAARAFPDVRVIVGEEVRTRDGEVLGLFLTEDVPRDLSARETIERIKAQGGVAGAPHPFDAFRTGLDGFMDAVADELDFVEGLNARMVFRRHNTEARKFARARGLPLTAASDAHSPREVGRAYVRMADFSTPTEFLGSLRDGKLSGRLSSPFIHWISRFATLRTKTGWRPPE
jgi:predicted metal-dependent phosphoesterase TrpH